jgi:hypothetical protein
MNSDVVPLYRCIGRPIEPGSFILVIDRFNRSSFSLSTRGSAISWPCGGYPQDEVHRAIDELVQSLLRSPRDLGQVRSPVASGGIPASHGVYAWWARKGSIPGVPPSSHPKDAGFGLFYVGIAPRNSKSRANLRSRVVGNHLSGNTGSSTFRYTLAALLLPKLVLHPFVRGKSFILPSDENRRLSSWRHENLSLTWAEIEEPWVVERQVIETLKPPLNLAENRQHSFHSVLSNARAEFRTLARSG